MPAEKTGCMPLMVGFVFGVFFMWLALYIMNGLTHGGIWK